MKLEYIFTPKHNFKDCLLCCDYMYNSLLLLKEILELHKLVGKFMLTDTNMTGGR